ncbi:hypothetical protein V5O48_005651 [Marasmius crinis-equi]|uniref:Uncharacterized protein n=1 Tax=Marasmius crinis-equi TaxID=585013 RepID=A0ABR3FMD8_9AGAR
MSYQLVHPLRPVTQRQEFRQRSGPLLTTQTIAVRRQFTKDSYIQAAWRNDEDALSGLEFSKLSGVNRRDDRTTPGATSIDYQTRSPSLPSSTAATSDAVQEGPTSSSEDESDEQRIAESLYQEVDHDPTEEQSTTEATTSEDRTPASSNVGELGGLVPKPDFQKYKNGQFPLKSLKTEYGWTRDRYTKVQKKCKELIPTYFDPQVSWMRQENKEDSEREMCEEHKDQDDNSAQLKKDPEFFFLESYEDCWPIHQFIQRTLKGTTEQARKRDRRRK